MVEVSRNKGFGSLQVSGVSANEKKKVRKPEESFVAGNNVFLTFPEFPARETLET